ncbi:hypothetical protein BPUTSESOX_375 [uncultured Gammaproteobacteria bacterium]|nr:hypothetical protein BPUTSESOX_375 [uncultured Gammaproteobacteria bacterium]
MNNFYKIKNLVKSTLNRVTHKYVDNSVNISIKTSKNIDILRFLMVLNKKQSFIFFN